MGPSVSFPLALGIAQKLPVRNSWELIIKKLPIPLPIFYYLALLKEVLANTGYLSRAHGTSKRGKGVQHRGALLLKASREFSVIFRVSFWINILIQKRPRLANNFWEVLGTISLLSVTPPPFSKYSAIGGHEPLEPLRAHTGCHNSCTFLCSLCSRECLPWRQRPSESKRHRDSAAAVLCKRASWPSRCHKADATETVLNLGEKEWSKNLTS